MHVIGTAGHVDHGKSTLVERLTGIDPDRFAEEKRRGLTIDLGFAWLTLPSGTEVGLVDVPGHERFVRNMLAGAGGVSICLFVVAANEGWKPQSAEHLAIVDILGIDSGVVALTKSDLVLSDELADRVGEVQRRIAASSLKKAKVVPVSAVTGSGVEDLVSELDRLVSVAPPPVDVGRPRLWVDRVFTIKGSGTVVTGTLMDGSFAVGDEVDVAPQGRRARIRAIQSHKKALERVGPGNRVALNIVGLDRQETARGDAVVAPGSVRVTRRVDVALQVASRDLLGRDHQVTAKGAYLLYVGSAEVPVAVRLLGATSLAPCERGFAHLRLQDPLPLRHGDRFVLRDVGRVMTVGGGVVLDPLAPSRVPDVDERVALLREMGSNEPETRLAALVKHTRQIDATEATYRAGLINDFTWVGTIAGGGLLSDEEVERLVSAARDAIGAHIERNPVTAGIPREDLRRALALDPDVFDSFIDAKSDVFGYDGRHVRLVDAAMQLPPEVAEQRDHVIAELERDGFNPPLPNDLGASKDELLSLAEVGEIVWIGGYYLSRDQAQRVRRLVRDAIETEGPVTVARIRDLLGTSRKYAVPLCEWLDSTGATIRRGDVRVLGPRA